MPKVIDGALGTGKKAASQTLPGSNKACCVFVSFFSQMCRPLCSEHFIVACNQLLYFYFYMKGKEELCLCGSVQPACPERSFNIVDGHRD